MKVFRLLHSLPPRRLFLSLADRTRSLFVLGYYLRFYKKLTNNKYGFSVNLAFGCSCHMTVFPPQGLRFTLSFLLPSHSLAVGSFPSHLPLCLSQTLWISFSSPVSSHGSRQPVQCPHYVPRVDDSHCVSCDAALCRWMIMDLQACNCNVWLLLSSH